MASEIHTGGCHCGAVRYEVTVDLANVLSCNCSYCTKAAPLLTFTTPDRFELRSGADNVSEYRFNTRNIQHLFCNTCGVESFARGTGPDGSEMIAINARCLDGIDPTALDALPFDGRNM